MLQANDKEAFLQRFISVEGTLKEAIAKQLAAEASLDGKVAAHNDQMQTMMRELNTHVEGKEAVLREQLEASMRKLRAYAREVEQNMESVRSRPWSAPLAQLVFGPRLLHCVLSRAHVQLQN